MLPTEYADLIEYAKTRKQSDFNIIILAMDFFGTNENYTVEVKKTDFYFKQSNKLLYRYSQLFCIDNASYSLKSFATSIGQTSAFDKYDRLENARIMLPLSKEQIKHNVDGNLIGYRNGIYANYKYRNMKEILEKIKKNNPKSIFIVFTTPVSEPLLQLISNMRLTKYYDKWISDCVDVFGSIYNFMYINSITTNISNYKDAHHFSPEVGRLIAHKTIGYPDKRIPADFGVLVTKQNIQEHLKSIHKNTWHR
jgi:hypothetical protein